MLRFPSKRLIYNEISVIINLESLNRVFVIGEKNIKYAARKMMLRKYDPIVNQYVLFQEAKLKK